MTLLSAITITVILFTLTSICVFMNHNKNKDAKLYIYILIILTIIISIQLGIHVMSNTEYIPYFPYTANFISLMLFAVANIRSIKQNTKNKL